MAKKTQKAEPKIWYATEGFKNPIDESIYPYESIEDAVKDWMNSNEGSDGKDATLYLYKIELIGPIKVKQEVVYEVIQ